MTNSVYKNPKTDTISDTDVALSALEALCGIVSNNDWKNAKELISLVKTKGQTLVQRSHGETIVLNTVLRILKIIREESVRILKGIPDFEENLTNVLFAVGDVDYSSVTADQVNEAIQSSIEELRSEIKNCLLNVATQSLWHIHSNEIIFTIGYSKDVFHFLKYAVENGRRFQVMVAECSPENLGHRMAKELEQVDIDVILIPDSHAFAVMSRVNKVIVSCHTVYTDGGLRAVVGTYGVMLAAERFSVPIYVCVPQYKVSPKFFPPNSLEWLGNPSNLSANCADSFGLISADDDTKLKKSSCEVVHPEWDYIPQGLVSLFVTNLAGNAPSYIYAMQREFFHKEDIQEAIAWDEGVSQHP